MIIPIRSCRKDKDNNYNIEDDDKHDDDDTYYSDDDGYDGNDDKYDDEYVDDNDIEINKNDDETYIMIDTFINPFAYHQNSHISLIICG